MVEFASLLRRQCDEVASRLDPASGLTLVCCAAPVLVRETVATPLSGIARHLIQRACRAFAGVRGGRIMVSLEVAAEGLELTVEHSRPETGATSHDVAAEEATFRVLLADIEGVIEVPHVMGGSRAIVTLRSAWCSALPDSQSAHHAGRDGKTTAPEGTAARTSG